MPKTTLDVFIPSMSERHVKSYVNDVLASDATATYSVNELRRSRTTVNTPGFRNKEYGKRKEDLPMNPFSYSENLVQYPYGIIDRKSDIYRDLIEGHLFPGMGGVNFEPRGVTSSDRSFVANEALLASLLDLKGQKVNIGVTLAERKSTSDLILDSAKKLGGSFRAFRRGDLKGAFRSFGNTQYVDNTVRRIIRAKKGRPSLSNEALAVQLGWKPLLSDVYSYAELLASTASDPPRYKVTTSRSHRWSGAFGPDEFWEGVNCHRREFGVHTVKYVYVFTGSEGVIPTLARLGVTNPLSWLWELTTLSFVVDWFLKIGDFIDALDATVGLTFEKGCKTTFEKYTIRYDARGTSADGNNYVNGKALRRQVLVNREPLTGFPGLPPVIIGSGLNFSRGITASALLRQFFKR